MAITATTDDLDQLELISDDPRVSAEDLGPLQLLQEFWAARREHGDLIARPLACEILGVTSGQLAVWCMRGRLTDVVIGPVKMVSAQEVQALWKERSEGGYSVGGRGKKLPSMAEVVRLGSQLTEK